jgi:uncharacterized protein
MIHPSTELRFIGPEVGYGVFATEFIPKGTITYVEDDLEVRIPESQFLSYTAPIRAVLDKYSYIDADGVRIMSWDFAKYVNHNCNFNSISTGYGFEIAIRDIHPGEELTDEYGIFNLEYPMQCFCGSPNCRHEVSPSDFDDFYNDWDKLIRGALTEVRKVQQPLWSLIDPELVRMVDTFLKNKNAYRSVYTMRRRNLKAVV